MSNVFNQDADHRNVLANPKESFTLPPRLYDYYNGLRAKELQESVARNTGNQPSQWLNNWAMSRLPNTDPAKKRWLWQQVNPGVPFPGDAQ